MIESIRLSNVASFGTTLCVLDALSIFNYFYGPNASGKTTISRVIADPHRFPDCAVNWKAHSPLEPLVYNRDFVEKHFRASKELPGIFTLGQKDTEAAAKIAVLKEECDKLASDIAGLKITLEGADGSGGKRAELVLVEDAFRDACWSQKQEHDAQLKVAFEGYRNNAKNFKDKVLEERANNKADLKTLDYIRDKAATVFAEDVARVAPLPTLDAASFLACETAPILAKKVIGKSDVDIAAMINRLGNSDWVRAGRAFLDANNDTCPFCQQQVTEAFTESLNAYFDESFEADSNAIARLISDYEAHSQSVATTIDTILAKPPSLLDASALAAKRKLLDARVELNRQRLLEKKKEPSRSIELESSTELLAEIATIIENANSAIADHNKTVDNLAKEKTALKAQVWKFLIETPLKNALATYDQKKERINKAITNLQTQIRDKEVATRDKVNEIRELERDTTSIQPTVDAINSLLRSFGFNSFSLAQADNKRCYKLLRGDGTDAKETLSEGEKTFVTFLYFYHLLKGSASESGVTNDRVVVIDDPVSSLDSDILFIVSTLIRKLCEEVRTNTTIVKQLFLLTHNVYFHKEVTFNKQRGDGKLREETFWTVRKLRGESQITSHTANPIKSSYELLWLEVRERNSGNLAIQNSLRRILESYFKILGGIDLDRIHDQFEGNEKLACRALLSWVNDGSHSAHDDLYVSIDEATIDLYLEVFRKIFEGQGHIEHYNMMMAGPTVAGVAP